MTCKHVAPDAETVYATDPPFYIHYGFFNGFIPKPLPKLAVNYVAGFIEVAIGIGLLFNATAKNAAT